MKRAIDHIRVLGVSDNGAQVDIGLGLAGTTQGVPLTIPASALSAAAFELLSAGHEVARKSSASLSPHGVAPGRKVLGCTQLAVTSSADGVACLVLRFGACELAVEVSTKDIHKALSLLDAQALGAIVPPTPRLQ